MREVFCICWKTKRRESNGRQEGGTRVEFRLSRLRKLEWRKWLLVFVLCLAELLMNSAYSMISPFFPVEVIQYLSIDLCSKMHETFREVRKERERECRIETGTACWVLIIVWLLIAWVLGNQNMCYCTCTKLPVPIGLDHITYLLYTIPSVLIPTQHHDYTQQ